MLATLLQPYCSGPLNFPILCLYITFQTVRSLIPNTINLFTHLPYPTIYTQNNNFKKKQPNLPSHVHDIFVVLFTLIKYLIKGMLLLLFSHQVVSDSFVKP